MRFNLEILKDGKKIYIKKPPTPISILSSWDKEAQHKLEGNKGLQNYIKT
jgi:hypothetical protein